jgi:hypothetical protein
LLKAFFGKVLGGFAFDGAFPGDQFRSLVEMVKDRCDARYSPNGQCFHLRDFLHCLEDTTHPPMWKLLRLCEGIFMQCAQCVTMKALLVGLVKGIAKLIDDVLVSEAFRVSPIELGARRTGKRSRVDEDFKEYIINDTIQLKTARSGAAALRASNSDVHFSAAAKWEKIYALRYQCAMFRISESTGTLGIAEDGARIGEPPEETQLYLAWDAAADVGIVLPPMVRPTFNTSSQSK